LGILGTFISIVWSLSQIDFDGKDFNIGMLVKNITPAFVTSIIGILGAIISSIWIKAKFAKQDQTDDNKKNTPEHSLRNIEHLLSASLSPSLSKIEHLFSQSLPSLSNIEALLEINIQETKTQSKQITDTLANQSNILKTFVDNFITNMNTIFADMRKSIETQTIQFGENLWEREKELVQSHINTTEQMMLNTNKQFEQLSDSLLDSVKKNITSFNNYILETANRLRKEYEFIEDHTAQLIGNYNQSTEAYRDAVQNAHDQNEKVSHLLETVAQSMGNCDNTNQKVIDTLDLITLRQENIQNLVAQIQQMSVAIESLQRLESQLNKLNR
jgi:biopolymer transport protein ExbB/TolQ